VRADVDEQQNFRAGFRMFLPRKNNPAIVTGGTRMKSGQSPAQVVRFQAGIIGVFRQPPQSRFDLRLQRGIFPGQTTERPFKLGGGNKLAHRSFALAQSGDEAFSRLAFQFAGAKSSDGAPGLRRCFLPPRFDAAPTQETFEYFLLLCRQGFSFGQDAI